MACHGQVKPQVQAGDKQTTRRISWAGEHRTNRVDRLQYPVPLNYLSVTRGCVMVAAEAVSHACPNSTQPFCHAHNLRNTTLSFSGSRRLAHNLRRLSSENASAVAPTCREGGATRPLSGSGQAGNARASLGDDQHDLVGRRGHHR